MTPELFNSSDYELYKQDFFSSRWLRKEDWQEFIAQLKPDPHLFSKETIGHSAEGRGIDCWSWGKGSVKLLIWSQMHGNEPTGTMALADLFGFLNSKDEGHQDLRSLLYDQLSLSFVPILNPDGAERFQRVNALGVDLNRDAQANKTTEMQAFMSLKDRFKPDYAFNIHDQRNIFSAGDQAKPATISFLAASSDKSRQITPARDRAMQIIAGMHEAISKEIPECIGRYSDEFYPRALGDYFHSEGIPCVLIESGAAINDPTRNTARKMNFLGLLSAFRQIAGELRVTNHLQRYLAIPENQELFCDLILRNVRFGTGEKALRMDLALMLQEKLNESGSELVKEYIIKEIGDLSFSYGLITYADVNLEYEELPVPGGLADLRVLRNGKTLLDFKAGRLINQK